MDYGSETDAQPKSFIEAIRAWPGMYLGEPSLRAFFHFLSGYQTALHHHGIKDDTTLDLVPRDFHDWVAYRTHFDESTSGWCNMIIETSESDAQAFDRFFELLAEHAARVPKVVAILKNKGGHYDQGDGPTPYPARIPLVVYTDDPGFFAQTIPGDERFYPYLNWLGFDYEPELQNYGILDEKRFMRIFNNLWSSGAGSRVDEVHPLEIGLNEPPS